MRVDGDVDFPRRGRRQQNGNDRRGVEWNEKKREEMRGSNIK